MSKPIPKCIFCDDPAVWKVKHTEKFVCEKDKILLDKKTEIVWIKPIEEFIENK